MTYDPIEQTNEYLEYLAGRGRKHPDFPEADKDIPGAVRLLRTLRTAAPRAEFSHELKQTVMHRHHVEKRPSRGPTFGRAFAGWRIAVPAMAIITALVALVVVPHFVSKTGPGTTGKPWQQFIAKEASAATIILEPTKRDQLGIAADTSFTLIAKDGSLTLPEVKEKFALTPRVDLGVVEKGKNTFTITPKTPLQEKTVYAASFDGLAKKDDGTTTPRTYSWAFQVRSEFQILGTLPRHKAIQVDPRTGIEVTFSTPGVTADEFRRHFAITPKVDGRVEVHQRTLVFVPTKPLATKTVYTVTISRGLKASDGGPELQVDEVFQFEVSTPKEWQAPSSRIVPPNYFEGVRPNQPIIFSSGMLPGIYDSARGRYTEQPYEFTVYQYPDLDAFEQAVRDYQVRSTPWAQFASTGRGYSLQGLKKVGTFKTVTKDNLITLGTGFASGWYLADSQTGGVNSQIPFQVTDLGAYSLATTTDTVVWLNDLASSKPLATAMLTLTDPNRTLTAGTDGVIRFPTPTVAMGAKAKPVFSRVTAGDRQSLIVLNGQPNAYAFEPEGFLAGSASDEFWAFLTSDRQIYKPTDTINVWGLARRRSDNVPVKSVHLDLIQRGYEERYQENVVKSLNLTTTSTGTFTGQLSGVNLATQNWGTTVVLSVDGQKVAERYLNIQTYTKPAFQITATPDRYAAISGDKVTYAIQASFYDGTPVPQAKLNIQYNYGSQGTVTTDDRGRASFAVTTQANTGSWLSITPADPAEGNVEITSSMMVYPAGLTVDAASNRTKQRGSISGTVRVVHPELADPTADDPLAKVIGEPQANQKVSGKLIAIVTTKVEDGSTYDFLAKRVVPTYHYETRDEERGSFTMITDAQGKFSRTFTLTDDAMYRVELSAADTKGRTATSTVYLYDQSLYQTSGGYIASGYSLMEKHAVEQQPMWATEYVVGDPIDLNILKDGQPIVSSENATFMFITAQRGLRRVVVQRDPRLAFTYTDDDVPSLSIRAVIFSGNGYQELFGPQLVFKRSSRSLTVTLTPDKETYTTGDTATIRVHVEDQDGRGRAARVNLSAIDEAIVSLQPWDDQDPLRDLYRPVSDGILGTFISHREFSSVSAAEGGGGGDQRIDFRDNALYTEIQTDANGDSIASFKLPDNLTAWRVTAYGVTNDLRVGKKTRLLPVRRPLFVVPTMFERQLDRDQQTIVVAAYGASLKATDEVALAVSLVGQPTTELKKTVRVFTPTTFALPKLVVGDYQVKVSASSGSFTDTVIRPLHVVGSNIVQRVVKVAYLARQESPAFAPSGRTTLTIGDADRNLAYETLWGLVWPSYGRLDTTAASGAAARLLDEEFKEKVYAPPVSLDAFATGKGLALYPIGSNDVEYASLVAGLPDAQSYETMLVSWFNRLLTDQHSNTEQAVQALYGLAQLGQPVLADVTTMLNLSDLPDREKLTLALALEALGAKEEARPIAAYLWQTYGHTQDQWAWLNLGSTVDDQIVSTGRFAILAAGLQLDPRYALLEYIRAHPSQDTTTAAEQALAMTRILALAEPGQMTVTYRLNGATATKTLSGKSTINLSLDEQEAKTFSITSFRGNVSIVSAYAAPFDPASRATDKTLTVSRKYSVNGKEVSTVKRGDIVKIEFRWSKKTDTIGRDFSLTDLLPTGLRPLTGSALYSRTEKHYSYPYAVEDNRVKFYAYRPDFFYLAQAVVDGSVVAEPPTLQALDAPGSLQFGPEQRLVIKE